ncbi:MAG TPA: cell division protein ZapA [Porticoccaceae bacterium]|nr:cell division protein ZapA [Porticoccaceae bacterium]HCO60028.1 cell division protein ZapA [Porticoccaceae bacterium]
MSSQETVQIRILDKEYQVQCPPEEKTGLLESAQALDARMREIRKSGTVIGLERIAVMAALNLSYDLLRAESKAANSAVDKKDLLRLDLKLSNALKSLK